jgi:hypothetical protein
MKEKRNEKLFLKVVDVKLDILAIFDYIYEVSS